MIARSLRLDSHQALISAACDVSSRLDGRWTTSCLRESGSSTPLPSREQRRAHAGATRRLLTCYGDRDWRFWQSTGDAQRPTPPSAAQEVAGIAAPSSIESRSKANSRVSNHQFRRIVCAVSKQRLRSTGTAAMPRKHLETHSGRLESSSRLFHGTSAPVPLMTEQRLSRPSNNWPTPGSVRRGTAWWPRVSLFREDRGGAKSN